MRGGAGSDATARRRQESQLLSGLKQLLSQHFSAADAPSPDDSSRNARANANSKARSKRSQSSLLVALQKMVSRSSDSQSDDSLLQRLSRLVNAASNGRHLGGKLHKRKAASSLASPPKGQPSPSGKGKSSGKSKPSPTGKGKSQSQPRVARSYTLLARHWEGQVVAEKDLLDSAATLAPEKILVCGVVDSCPDAVRHLSLAQGASVVIVADKEAADSVEMRVPVVDSLGRVAIHSAFVVVLGSSCTYLRWKPREVTKALPAFDPPTTLSVAVCHGMVSSSTWTKLRDSSQATIIDLMIGQGISKNDIIDVVPCRMNDARTMVSSSVKLKTPAANTLLACSGKRGLLSKVRASSPSTFGVEWIKRLPAETSFDYLARAHTASVSATPGRGLAFSSAGSLGLLYPKDEIAASFRVYGMPSESPPDVVFDFLSQVGWRDTVVTARLPRGSKVVWQFRARVPSGEDGPWAYTLPNN